MDNQVIRNFKQSEYSFLSNMYPCNIEFKGMKFLCSESAFQSEKCRLEVDKE